MIIDSNAPVYANEPIVCSKCKKESSYTSESLLLILIDKNILCEGCGEVIVSNKPEMKTYSYVGSTSSTNCRGVNDGYDYFG